MLLRLQPLTKTHYTQVASGDRRLMKGPRANSLHYELLHYTLSFGILMDVIRGIGTREMEVIRGIGTRETRLCKRFHRSGC